MNPHPEVNHPAAEPPPSSPDPTVGAAVPTREGTPPTLYTVSTTARPTVRLSRPAAAVPPPTGPARSGSIRVGTSPNHGRLLRHPAANPPADTGWTRPVNAQPFVTRSFSGLRIRASDHPPIPAAVPPDGVAGNSPAI